MAMAKENKTLDTSSRAHRNADKKNKINEETNIEARSNNL
jgi:hypothetical protein